MLLSYRCDSCGGELLYNPNNKLLVCSNCSATKEVKEVYKHDKKYKEWDDNVRETTCVHCGAEIVADTVTVSTFCAFCGEHIIFSDRLVSGIRPTKIIPFQIDKYHIQKIFKKWCGNGLITFNEFKAGNKIDKLTGIYIPFWVFDCTGNISYKAIATKVKTYTKGDKEITETSYYEVYRDITADCIRMPENASENMLDDFVTKLEPYNFMDWEKFELPYLAGFHAEKFSYTDDEKYPKIQTRVKAYMEKLANTTITGCGYTTIRMEEAHYDVKKLNAEYTLLPVWTLNYYIKDKTYIFAVNGQTGKIVGVPPLSMTKMFIWFSIYTLISFIIVSLIGGLIL